MTQNSVGLAPPIFDKDKKDEWKAYLETEGFAVIGNIQTEEEMITGYNQFIKDLKSVSPRFNSDSDSDSGSLTSSLDINTCPIMFGKGMGVFNGFGQSDGMWHLRTNKTIQSIFKEIYNTDELVTSLDGFSLFVSKAQKSKSWLHIDQNPKNKIYSIQGSYNYLPVKDVKDAGFVVVPKSHINYKPDSKSKGDWLVCDPQPITESRKLIIPKNCLTIWNSKTIHANEGMKKSNIEINRLTCYITYQPKSLRTEAIKKKRIDAYLSGKATSHWANKCELKKYPFGFKSRYEARGFGTIKPRIIEAEKELFNKGIPIVRFNLL